MAGTKAQELYRAGHLAEAIAAATQEVRSHPNDLAARGFLAGLYCFAGEIERADRQLEMIAHQDTTQVVGISNLRQVLRAEQARQQFHSEGRLPEFFDEPSECFKLHLRASIHLRDNQPVEAATLFAEAETKRVKVHGTCDGKAFDDLRDIDDLTACFFEVLTTTGKYFWMPFEQIETIEFHPPDRLHELLWRRAHMIVRSGPDAEVYIPVLYAGASKETDDRIRLGRMTDWRGGENAPLRGVGQRMYQVGGEDVPLMEMKALAIEPPPA